MFDISLISFIYMSGTTKMINRNKNITKVILAFYFIAIAHIVTSLSFMFSNSSTDSIALMILYFGSPTLIWTFQIKFGIKDLNNNISSKKEWWIYNTINFLNFIVSGLVLFVALFSVAIDELLGELIGNKNLSNNAGFHEKFIEYGGVIILIVLLIFQGYLIKKLRGFKKVSSMV